MDVDFSPLTDALAELMAVIITAFFVTITDVVLWALWDTVVNLLSTEHLGQAPTIIFLTLGLLFSIWFYWTKFLVR